FLFSSVRYIWDYISARGKPPQGSVSNRGAGADFAPAAAPRLQGGAQHSDEEGYPNPRAALKPAPAPAGPLSPPTAQPPAHRPAQPAGPLSPPTAQPPAHRPPPPPARSARRPAPPAA